MRGRVSVEVFGQGGERQCWDDGLGVADALSMREHSGHRDPRPRGVAAECEDAGLVWGNERAVL